jgi:hypothetical protein
MLTVLTAQTWRPYDNRPLAVRCARRRSCRHQRRMGACHGAHRGAGMLTVTVVINRQPADSDATYG